MTTKPNNLSKFIKIAMKHGKHETVQRIMFTVFSRLIIAKTSASNLETILSNAISSGRPLVSIKSVKVAGRSRSVPYILPKEKAKSITLRWILEAAKKNRVNREAGNSINSYDIQKKKQRKILSSGIFSTALFSEIQNLTKKTGTVRRRRDELHKIAESSRSFAHYRWW